MGAEPYIDFPEPVPVDAIEVRPGREPLSEEVVAAEMESISTLGFISPVVVRWASDEARMSPEGDGGHAVLVDGLHRLEAAKRLGFKRVPIVQVGYDFAEEDHAALAEIELNRVRKHDDVATQVLRTNRAIELRSKVRAAAVEHEAAKEADAARQREERTKLESDWRARQGESDSRAEASRAGVGIRTVQLRRQWADKLAPETWPIIQANPCVNNVRFLKRLAKVPVAKQLAFIQEAVRSGGKFPDPQREANALRRAWAKASDEVRRDFLKPVIPLVVDAWEERRLGKT